MSAADRERRPFLDHSHPDTYAALLATAKASRTACQQAGLDRSLLELVNVPVSQINGCVACLTVHTEAARREGVTQLAPDLLVAWRDGSTFGAEERAVLGLAEALTLPGHPGLEEARAEVRAAFSTEALAALEWAIVLINAFNRVSIASGHPARR